MDVIGKGAFSSIHKARRISTGEIFAVKVTQTEDPEIEH
jgi:hypothetical protein